uniref:Uncharacterized protein n=1 Tax=Cacopsylla melanoneura TaxID=428564 RepID=A0A8D8XB01_9HEMI
MLSQQYLVSCQQSDHPCNSIVTSEPPPRDLRKTVQSEKEHIADLLPTQNIDKTTGKILMKEVHTRIVENTIRSYTPNRVLNAKPPDIARDEHHVQSYTA